MNSDTLESLTDTQLNDRLAALLPAPSHSWIESLGGADTCDHCARESWQDEAPCHIWYCNAPSVILPLLSRLSPDWSSRTYGGQTVVSLWFIKPGADHGVVGVGSTLARAGTMAAIRAIEAGGVLR